MMENIFASIRSPFYEFAVKMNLSLISRKDLFNFILGKFNQYKVPIIDKTIDDILDKSGCHPHYTQYFASVVFDLINNGYDQHSDAFSETWLNRVLLPQTDIFQNIYDQLTNSQRAALEALSMIEDIGIYSDEARQTYDLPVSSSLTEALKALQKKAIIIKQGDEYIISNPLLKEWVSRL